MRCAIVDTSVYINDWERGAHQEALARVVRAFVIRHSSVVLSELRRGARSDDARRLVGSLFKLARVCWAPLPSDWWEAGQLIQRIGDAHDWDARRRRDFQNDALIAFTARRYGATVVTSDHADFDLLARHLGVRVVAV
jgi:predicted nucleic acid-binding protein